MDGSIVKDRAGAIVIVESTLGESTVEIPHRPIKKDERIQQLKVKLGLPQD